MRKLRLVLVAAAIGLFAVVPASPAQASHTCGLDGPVGAICDNYHNPKPLLSYLVCLISPTC